MYITIVKRPDGEAPEWVRDAWIGLRVPTISRQPKRFAGIGVVSGSNNLFVQLFLLLTGRGVRGVGYYVNARDAVSALGEAHPDAAGWWRTNCSRMLDGRQVFVFNADECESDGA